MTPSDDIVDFVAAWEGLRTKSYQDIVGVWTIGYGRTQGVERGMFCTKEQAREWLVVTLADFGGSLEGYMRRVPTMQQYDALLSLAYNVGVSAVGESGVMSRFNAGLDQECADRFLIWNRAGGRVVDGLSRRRKAEREIYLFGQYDGRP